MIISVHVVCVYHVCVVCMYVVCVSRKHVRHCRSAAGQSVCSPLFSYPIISAATVNKNNALNLPDDWSCGANAKGSMTVELFMSLCVHHVENNLKPKGYGAGGKASILVFDGHASRWSYAGLMYLMANNCWPFCLASHTSTWAQVSCRCYTYELVHITLVSCCFQVGDNAINAMLRAALADEVAYWRSQFGCYIAFTRNDFNQCFAAAFARVQVRRLYTLFRHACAHQHKHTHEYTPTCAHNTHKTYTHTTHPYNTTTRTNTPMPGAAYC